MKSLPFFVLVALTVTAVPAQSGTQSVEKEIAPREVSYERLAFYPKRWRKAEADFDMLSLIHI